MLLYELFNISLERAELLAAIIDKAVESREESIVEMLNRVLVYCNTTDEKVFVSYCLGFIHGQDSTTSSYS